jgi:nitrogenase molybdenum-iron protein alpha/beta subunit
MLIVVGCGASTHAASVLITEQLRDFEDYSLEPIQLQVTNIEEFDIVFGRLQDLLNRWERLTLRS